jgi:hypothetical protein
MTTRPGYVWDATASEWVEIGQAAVVAPVAYQASEPSSPATGDIWIDSDDEVPSVDSTLYYRWTKTMSGGETSLSGTDNNSLALEYTPGYESVFINGVLQVRGSDYVATTGTTVTGLTALTASDVVMVESIIAYSVGDTYTQSQIGSLLDAKSPVSTTGAVLVASATIGTAVSSVEVSNAFSSAYDNYKIVISGGVASAGQDVYLQLGTSTPTYSTTGYYSIRVGWRYAGTAGNFVDSNNGSNFLVGSADSNGINVNVELQNPNLAKRTYFSGAFLYSTITAFTGGYHEVATSYTNFKLTYSSGTWTGGTIKVYGYK